MASGNTSACDSDAFTLDLEDKTEESLIAEPHHLDDDGGSGVVSTPMVKFENKKTISNGKLDQLKVWDLEASKLREWDRKVTQSNSFFGNCSKAEAERSYGKGRFPRISLQEVEKNYGNAGASNGISKFNASVGLSPRKEDVLSAPNKRETTNDRKDSRTRE